MNSYPKILSLEPAWLVIYRIWAAMGEDLVLVVASFSVVEPLAIVVEFLL